MIGTKIIEERKSKFNGNLRVVKTWGMGTYIQAGGLTQSGGIVNDIWRETLRQVKSEKREAKSCLILGLGGGTVAKLIRKHWSDARITGVDIDPIMIELGKKYLGLNQNDIKIKVGDAFKELKIIKKNYDLAIVDLYNGDEFPEQFENEKFLKLVESHLKDGGMVVFNRLYFGDKRPQAVKFGNKLKGIFSRVEWFYPEANLMFICSV